MRTVPLALSCLLAIVAACATSSEPVVETAASDISCPGICGDDTLCRLPTGGCTEACNPCMCEARGGFVDPSCAQTADESPAEIAAETTAAAAQVSTAEPGASIVIGGGQCGPNVCAAGSYCCNAGCGTCARVGDLCTEQVCEPTD